MLSSRKIRHDAVFLVIVAISLIGTRLPFWVGTSSSPICSGVFRNQRAGALRLSFPRCGAGGLESFKEEPGPAGLFCRLAGHAFWQCDSNPVFCGVWKSRLCGKRFSIPYLCRLDLLFGGVSCLFIHDLRLDGKEARWSRAKFSLQLALTIETRRA